MRVIAWTVNNSLQRAYLDNFLRVTSMSDTMDRVPLGDILREAAGESAAESALTDADAERVDLVRKGGGWFFLYSYVGL